MLSLETDAPAASASRLRRPFFWTAGALVLGSAIGCECLGWGPVEYGLALVALLVGARFAPGVERRAALAFCVLALLAAGRAAMQAAAEQAALLHLEREPVFVHGYTQACSTLGRFVQTSRWGEHVQGVLAQNGLRLEVRRGCVANADVIALYGRGQALRYAQPCGDTECSTPGAGVDAIAPLARTRVLPDEIVCLRCQDSGLWIRLMAQLERVRDWLRARLSGISDTTARGLCCGLLLGDSSAVPQEVLELFGRTGTRHILALSGMHVAWAGFFLVRPLLRRCWSYVLTPRRVAPYLQAASEYCLVGGLVLLWGGEAPVLRAGLAWVLTSVAALIPARAAGAARVGRRADGLNLLGFSACVECLWDPRIVLDLGFTLSYSATLGLIVGYGPLRRRLGAGFGAGITAPSLQSHSHWYWMPILHTRTKRFVLEGTAASLAALLATLPIVWAQLGEWTWVALPATLGSFPWMVAIMLEGLLELCFPTMHPSDLLNALARGWVGLLTALDQLPGTPTLLATRPGWLLFGVGSGWLLLLAGRLAGCNLLQRLLALASAILCLPWRPDPRHAEVHALDVGHGTCVYLRLPGGTDWIYDAGSRDRLGLVRCALAPTLRRMESCRLGVVESHADADHAGGLPWLRQRCRIEIDLRAESAQPSVRKAHGGGYLKLVAGRLEYRLSSHMRLTLWRALAQSGNEGSLALRLDSSSGAVLLLGDCEQSGLRALLKAGAARGPLSLLLATHHGSDSPHLGPLLEDGRPALVWVSSAGRPEIASELDRLGLPWCSTGERGSLRLELSPASGLHERRAKP